MRKTEWVAKQRSGERQGPHKGKRNKKLQNETRAKEQNSKIE